VRLINGIRDLLPSTNWIFKKLHSIKNRWSRFLLWSSRQPGLQKAHLLKVSLQQYSTTFALILW